MLIFSSIIETLFYSLFFSGSKETTITATEVTSVQTRPSLVVSTDDCGIGLVPNSRPVDGRAALPNEVPFVVPIIIWRKAKNSTEFVLHKTCLGTVINANWVLTSYECQKDDYCWEEKCNEVEHVIYPGIQNLEKAILEPKVYKTTNPITIGGNGTFLTMLKLETPIDLSNKATVRSVCLPKSKSVNNEDALALISGFPYNKELRQTKSKLNANNIELDPIETLHIGWLKVLGNNNTRSFKGDKTMTVDPLIPVLGQRGCLAASGSPVVHYVDNRAVLIGMNQHGEKKFVRCYQFLAQTNGLARISYFVDEISKTIKEK